MAHIGEGFKRVRIGIGHPGHKDLVHGYVLTNFPKDDQVWFKAFLEALPKVAPLLVDGNDVRFQSDLAVMMAPFTAKKDDK